ncbi:MAG: reverse transcriptase family protein [Pseudomonadota bacterium]
MPDPFRSMAALILAQGWDKALMTAALNAVLERPAQARQTVDQAMRAWTQPYPPGERALAAILEAGWFGDRPDMPPISAPAAPHRPGVFAGAGLPEIDGIDGLATWLDLPVGQLLWLADCDGRLARDLSRQGHYNQIFLKKRKGLRLVEAPLPRLKAVQRQILNSLLDKVPAHADATGFVRGRDCRTGAARHSGQAVVIRLDLAEFFPSIPSARIHAIFRTLGYPDQVARLLTGLTTTRTPADAVLALAPQQRAHHRAPHLPQGAPTSPALANLAARRLDVRLAGLARRIDARYSRYADDITFSGDTGIAFDGGAPILEVIAEIVADCGFRLNPAKTRIQRSGGRQMVTGIVVNSHLNVPRDAYDRLKATVHNCLRHGPDAQNRAGHPDFRAHLEGRIAWIAALNPRRAAKLYAVFDRIDWHRGE